MLSTDGDMEYRLRMLQIERLAGGHDWLGINPRSSRATRGWLEKQMDRFSYKPGWWWRVTESCSVIVNMSTEDVYNPGRQVTVSGGFDAGYLREGDEDMFAYLFAKHIRGLEDHESREWLKRDGVVYDDPHKADSAR